jgi:hypothetical protein
VPIGGTYLTLSVACLWLIFALVLLPIYLVKTLRGSSLLHPGGFPGVSLQVPIPRSGLTRCVLSGLLALRLLDVSCGLDWNGLPLHCTWGVSGFRHFRLLHGTWLRHLGLQKVPTRCKFIVPCPLVDLLSSVSSVSCTGQGTATFRRMVAQERLGVEEVFRGGRVYRSLFRGVNYHSLISSCGVTAPQTSSFRPLFGESGPTLWRGS